MSRRIQLIPIPPPVEWAQNKEEVFLKLKVECDKPEILIEIKCVTFEGMCKPDDTYYAQVIGLHACIDYRNSWYVNKGTHFEVVLKKKENDLRYWPRLTMDNKIPAWLSIDAERWQEEETNDEEDKEKSGVADNNDTDKTTSRYDDLLNKD